jgi:hypothetical protein
MKRMFGPLLAAVALCAFAPAAWPQTAARVSGVVQTSSGRPIAGAKVTAVGQSRSEKSEAVSGDDGAFAFPQLAADTYQVSAAAAGFSEYAVVVEVGVGQTRTVQLSLNTAAESTVIAVAKDAATADLSSARLSANITPVEVSAMPLNGRSYSILTLFAPGASNRADGGFDKLSFSGQPTRHNRYNFDGIDASSVIDPNPGWFPVVGTQFRLQTSLETIQEFRVDSALQPAEYGMGAGGHVNVISKAGGSQLHGSVYENFRHSDLAARDFFAAGDSRLRMNQYGAAAGGPIPRVAGKDRAFFFAAFEKLSESSRVGGPGVVPTQILLSVMNPATRQLVATMPVAQVPLSSGMLISLADRSGLSRLGEWNASGRLDFNLTDQHRLALRYVKAKEGLDTLDQTTVTPRSMQAQSAPDNAMASWSGPFGPVLNELKFGLNRAPTGLAYTTPYSWMSGIGVLPGAQLAGWMFGATGRQAGGDYGRASDYRSRSYSVLENLTWTGGQHLLKAGFELRAVRVPLTVLGGSVYSFSTLGFIANLGATASYVGDLQAEARQSLYGAFIQDEWRIRGDLILNAGLRYEYYTPVAEANGQARVFDMSHLNYLPTGSGFYQAGKLGFAPRLGLAWAPAALHSRTILRVGGAVHYSPGQLRDFLGSIENAATRFSVDGVSFPADLSAATGRSVQNPIGIDSSSQFPERVYQWGFSLQQVLPARFTAQAAYLGSAGRGLITRRWGNLVTGMTPYGSLVRQNPAFGEIAYVAGGGSDNYHALQLQLSRRFTDDLLVGVQYSWSHNITDTPSDESAIQDPDCLRCEKGPADFDLRHSAAINAHYRIPLGRGSLHLKGGALGYLAAGWSVGTIFNVRTGLPVNVSLPRPDVTWVSATGRIVSPGASGALPILGTPYGGGVRGGLRPSIQAGVDPYLSGRFLVFNPAAFTVPSLDSYGNMGRNALTGPGFSQLDCQITREFRFGDQSALAFRADFYNLLNHPNFAQPSATLVNVDPLVQPGEAFDRSQSANFGVITSSIGRNLGLGASRQIQLGLRLSF